MLRYFKNTSCIAVFNKNKMICTRSLTVNAVLSEGVQLLKRNPEIELPRLDCELLLGNIFIMMLIGSNYVLMLDMFCAKDPIMQE